MNRVIVAMVLMVMVSATATPVGAAAGDRRPGWMDAARRDTKPSRLAASLRDDLAAGRPVKSAAVAAATPGADAARSVRVVVEATSSEAAAQALRHGGGTVVAVGSATAKVDVPAAALGRVVEAGGVLEVREPLMAKPDAVSEGVTGSGADPWHVGGWAGAGVKVAVLDVGFGGYSSKLGSELPESVDTDFSRCSTPMGSQHGSAVAEVIHDVAPASRLRLVCIEDDTDFVSALSTLAASRVKVVSVALGNPLWGRGDASSSADSPAGAVAALRRQGVLVVSSAGNYGERHFHTQAVGDDQSGSFDDFVDITPSEMFTFTVAGSGVGSVAVKWDAWPRTSLDFDVYVGNDTCGIVGASEDDQSGVPGGSEPVEYVEFPSCSPGPQNFAVIVNRFSGTGTPRIDLFFDGDVTSIEQVTGGSVSEPASSPAAFAVGAVCSSGGVEAFSSRGPTIDNRTKPDIAGPDAVSTATFGGGGVRRWVQGNVAGGGPRRRRRRADRRGQPRPRGRRAAAPPGALGQRCGRAGEGCRDRSRASSPRSPGIGARPAAPALHSDDAYPVARHSPWRARLD